MRIYRMAVAVAFLMAGLVIVLSRPDSARALATGVVQGGGTISPGLTTVSTPQSFTFTGTMTGVGTFLGSCSMSASGSSIGGETILTGQGSASGTCPGGPSGSLSFDYIRVGAVMLWTGGIIGELMWFGASTPPVTAYTLGGTVQVVDNTGLTTTTTNVTVPPTTGLPTIPPTIPVTVPTTVPSTGGGIAGPSKDCVSNLLFDGAVAGVHGKLLVSQPNSTTVWVCIRAENGAQGYGGKLEIILPSASPGSAGLPTTDTNASACWPDNNPLVKIDVPAHLWADVATGPELWVCVEGPSGGTRLKWSAPSPTYNLGDVNWYPDPGTPG